MRHAVLKLCLRGRKLVIPLELHLVVYNREDRIGSPFLLVGRAALRRAATAPFVGEEDLRAVVVECRGVPIGEVRIRDRIQTLGVRGITNIQQDAVPLTGATGESLRRVHRDVVTLPSRCNRIAGLLLRPHHPFNNLGQVRTERRTVSSGRRARPAARLHNIVEHRPREVRREHHFAHPWNICREATLRARVRGGLGPLLAINLRLAVTRRHLKSFKDIRPIHDRRVLRMRDRHLDDFNTPQRRVGILVRRRAHAPRKFVSRTNGRRPRDVDVDVLLVGRALEHRVRVRPATGLHIFNQLGMRNVGDVENTDAANAILRHGIWHAAAHAVHAAIIGLGGHEQQVLVHRHVVLRRRARKGGHQRRLVGVRNVPHLQPVVVALDRVVPRECDVGVCLAQESGGRCDLGVDA